MGNKKFYAGISEVWDKESLDRTISVIISSKENKAGWVRWLDKHIIWFLIFLALTGSFIASASFLPLLFVIADARILIALGVIGLSFGIFFEFLIADIEVLEKRHHLTLLLIIPTVSLASFLSVIYGIQRYGMHSTSQYILIGGFIYIATFLLPFVAYEQILKQKEF